MTSPNQINISDARQTAWRALGLIRNQGMRVEAALARVLAPEEAPDQPAIDQRDRALAFELTYGVCRWQGWLDYVLDRFTSRPFNRIDPELQDILRLGAYQILKLNRIPDRAAVSATVEVVKSIDRHKAGFVNAVLRSVVREGRETKPPRPGKGLARHLAIAQSHPQWVVKRWLDQFGKDETNALLEADNQPPNLVLRTDSPARRDELIEALTKAGLTAVPGRYAPTAVIAPGAGLARIEQVAPGRVWAQSEAAQLVGLAVSPRPGWTTADACSGVGGKTFHLAQLMAGQGRLIALEPDRDRHETAKTRAAEAGLDWIEFIRGDARTDLPAEAFDVVLVDAPCTGSGVWRSRPDGRWRIRPGDPERMAETQADLIEAAGQAVKPGGALVYATCSLFDEENERVIERFLERRKEFELTDLADLLPGRAKELIRPGGLVKTSPARHNLDGFFIARMIKKK